MLLRRRFLYLLKILVQSTGYNKNFDWKEPKMEKSCDVTLVMIFRNVIMMVSLT